MRIETVVVPARDGASLAADWYIAAEPSAIVVFAPAMGVKRGYYSKLARYLAERGAAVLVVDYRGIGGSLRGPITEETGDLFTWAEQDLGGAVDAARARFPDLPVRYLAHSVGGQLMGFVSNLGVDRALFVASQMGYWRLWNRGRTFMFCFWYAMVPSLTALTGRLPMSRFRAGEDVPRNVARQWARWGRHPRYLLSEEGRTDGFAAYRGELALWSIEDDTYAPPRSVEALGAVYSNARLTVRRIDPAQERVRSIGHFGVFKPSFADTLWRDAAAFLLDPRV